MLPLLMIGLSLFYIQVYKGFGLGCENFIVITQALFTQIKTLQLCTTNKGVVTGGVGHCYVFIIAGVQ